MEYVSFAMKFLATDFENGLNLKRPALGTAQKFMLIHTQRKKSKRVTHKIRASQISVTFMDACIGSFKNLFSYESLM
jgi:hypothetical protein